MTMLDHRMTKAAEKMQALVKDAQANDPEKLARLEEAGSLDSSDLLALGDFATKALLTGLVDQDESVWMYGVWRDWTDRPLWDRLTYLRAVNELHQAGVS